MLRRLAAVGVLALTSISFAFKFRPPASTPEELEARIAEVEIEVPPSTTRVRSTLPTPTTTTIPPLPPGVEKIQSGFVRFGRGVLQLEVTLDMDVMTDIEMIRTPHSSTRAKETNIKAHEILRAEALEIQHFRVHVVSGATETTYGWARALRDVLQSTDFCLEPKCDQPLV